MSLRCRGARRGERLTAETGAWHKHLYTADAALLAAWRSFTRSHRSSSRGAFIRSAQAANADVGPRQRSVLIFEERRIGAQGREILEEQREIALFAENV